MLDIGWTFNGEFPPMRDPQPNIVLLMCDQMRFDCAGFAGSPVARTPALDRLSEEGVCFETACCASPVCSPARASWLTGLYPHAHMQLRNLAPVEDRPGYRMPADVITISDVLHAAGYRCGIAGPWHLGNDGTPQHGFNAMWATYRYQAVETDPYHQYLSRRELEDILKRHPAPGFMRCAEIGELPVGTSPLPTEHQRTSWTVDRGIEFCREQESPFFLFLSIKDPHPPILPPREYLPLYPFEEMPVSVSWNDTLEGKPAFLGRDKRYCARRFGYEGIQKIVAHYLALITHIDAQIARLLAALDDMGIAENTIVAFISDHGEMLGDHGMFAKGVMYEAAVRVPCLLRWPGRIPAGLKLSTPLSGVDLMPTLLDLAGVPLSSPVHGRSVAGPILEGKEPSERPVIAEIASLKALDRTDTEPEELAATVMIRCQGWKYIRHRFDIDELYDMEADPGEMTNLAGRSDQADRVAHMRQLIAEALTPGGADPYEWCLQ